MADPVTIAAMATALGGGVGQAVDTSSKNDAKKRLAAAQAKGLLVGRTAAPFEEGNTWAPIVQGTAAAGGLYQGGVNAKNQKTLADAYAGALDRSGNGSAWGALSSPVGPSLMQGMQFPNKPMSAYWPQ